MKMKKLVAMLLALAMVLVMLTACGSSSSSSSSTSSDGSTSSSSSSTSSGDESSGESSSDATVTISEDAVLRVGCDGEPNSLFPNYMTNRTTNRVDSCMYDTLVHWNDETKEAEPWLATEWEWLDDEYTQIEFTLRDDVYYTDGTQMIAEDIIYCLNASCSYTLSAYTQMFDIDNSYVIDDTHVVIALTSSYPNLLEILGCNYYAIFSPTAFKAVDEDTATFAYAPVASGPYYLAEWKAGESITLKRNDNWWNTEEMPYYAEIVVSFISDASSRALALEAGDIDVTFSLDSTQVEELESYGLTVDPYVQNTASPITFNMVDYPALADEDIRHAILLAVDYEALANATSGGYADVSYSSLLSTASPYYYASYEGLEQDVDAAKELVEASGWSSDDLTFTVYIPTGMDSTAVEMMQYSLGQIGITMNLVTVDGAQMLSDSWNDSSNSTLGMSENDCWDISRMLDFIDPRCSDLYTYTYSGEYEDELIELIDTAKTADDEDRYDAYAAVQQFCSDHYMMAACTSAVVISAWDSNLTGMQYDAHGLPNVWAMHPVS